MIQFTNEEIAWITKHFCILHQHRQDYVQNNKKVTHMQRLSNTQNQTHFKPTICEKSKKILEKKDPKNEMAKDMPYHEYLIMRGKQYKEK